MKLYLLFALASLIGLYTFTKEHVPASELTAPKERPAVYCAPTYDPTKIDGDAPLLKGLGNIQYPVTTISKRAQEYFNQGLALTYGFNHSEAARSFKTAIKNDPSFAMGYWGLAMVWGPNYNAALNPTSLADINNAIDSAVKYAKHASPNEKALIYAMRKRFPVTEHKDMTPYYEWYANAMKQAHEQFPADVDIATLYADALMNLHPWNLWLKDGTAQPWTPEILALLGKILAKNPSHPGAMHYYIHATEASKQAEKALPYADRLRDAMPAAGHMVHMPSHTYIRTGDYHKAVVANEKASTGDSIYVAQCKAQGFYPLLLYPHNIHFLAASAFLEGSSRKALDAAWMVSRKADRKFLNENLTVQHFYIIPYYVLVHLGKWDDILQLRHPGEQLKYPAAIWHYARGMAQVGKGNLAAAATELTALKAFAGDDAMKSMLIWDMNSAHDLINIAANVLEGEMLSYRKKYAEGKAKFYNAIAIEDRLMYNEPPDWFFSVRHTLGHWLVTAGEYAEAEKVYRDDLETFKENGWALIGLYNSLKGQNKNDEAIQVKKRFDKAWQYADVVITSSRKFR